MRRAIQSAVIASVVLAAPLSADPILTSYARSSEAFFRTYVENDVTTFSLWTKPLGRFDRSLIFSSPAFDYSYIGGYGILGFNVSTVGDVLTWGNPIIPFDAFVADFGIINGWKYEFYLQLEPHHTNTGIYGCDVPESAYDLNSGTNWPEYSGFYQICPENGYDGWVSIEIEARGTWTLNDLSMDLGQLPDAGPVAVPEPATLLMLATGLFGVIGVARRREREHQE